MNQKIFYGDQPKDGVLIATTPGWELYRRKQSDGWQNMKLIATGRRKGKANYHLAHNGDRLARNTDSEALLEHEPDLYAWVDQQCR